MTDATVVKRSSVRLGNFMRAGDWKHADRELQYFVGTWLRGRPRGADSAEVASIFDELRMYVVTEHDVDQTVGPSQLAWMLGAVCSLLNQAVTPAEVDAHGVEGRILVALAEADDLVSTKDLAGQAKCSYSTAARILPVLRAQELTTSVSAGKFVMNGITSLGREKATEVSEELRRRKPVPVVGPSSLERGKREGLVAMDVNDVVKTLEPNDPHALIRAKACA